MPQIERGRGGGTLVEMRKNKKCKKMKEGDLSGWILMWSLFGNHPTFSTSDQKKNNIDLLFTFSSLEQWGPGKQKKVKSVKLCMLLENWHPLIRLIKSSHMSTKQSWEISKWQQDCCAVMMRKVTVVAVFVKSPWFLWKTHVEQWILSTLNKSKHGTHNRLIPEVDGMESMSHVSCSLNCQPHLIHSHIFAHSWHSIRDSLASNISAKDTLICSLQGAEIKPLTLWSTDDCTALKTQLPVLSWALAN